MRCEQTFVVLYWFEYGKASSGFVRNGNPKVETIFHFFVVLHMHASIEKSPDLGILCTMTRDEVIGICRKDLRGECLVLFTTHCIRGIGHRIHPDVRLPVVSRRSGCSLEVPCEVGGRPRGALKIELSFNYRFQESPRIEEESRSRRVT